MSVLAARRSSDEPAPSSFLERWEQLRWERARDTCNQMALETLSQIKRQREQEQARQATLVPRPPPVQEPASPPSRVETRRAQQVAAVNGAERAESFSPMAWPPPLDELTSPPFRATEATAVNVAQRADSFSPLVVVHPRAGAVHRTSLSPVRRAQSQRACEAPREQAGLKKPNLKEHLATQSPKMRQARPPPRVLCQVAVPQTSSPARRARELHGERWCEPPYEEPPPRTSFPSQHPSISPPQRTRMAVAATPGSPPPPQVARYFSQASFPQRKPSTSVSPSPIRINRPPPAQKAPPPAQGASGTASRARSPSFSPAIAQGVGESDKCGRAEARLVDAAAPLMMARQQSPPAFQVVPNQVSPDKQQVNRPPLRRSASESRALVPPAPPPHAAKAPTPRRSFPRVNSQQQLTQRAVEPPQILSEPAVQVRSTRVLPGQTPSFTQASLPTAGPPAVAQRAATPQPCSLPGRASSAGAFATLSFTKVSPVKVMPPQPCNVQLAQPRQPCVPRPVAAAPPNPAARLALATVPPQSVQPISASTTAGSQPSVHEEPDRISIMRSVTSDLTRDDDDSDEIGQASWHDRRDYARAVGGDTLRGLGVPQNWVRSAGFF